jgi:hypothetical protein
MLSATLDALNSVFEIYSASTDKSVAACNAIAASMLSHFDLEYNYRVLIFLLRLQYVRYIHPFPISLPNLQIRSTQPENVPVRATTR